VEEFHQVHLPPPGACTLGGSYEPRPCTDRRPLAPYKLGLFNSYPMLEGAIRKSCRAVSDVSSGLVHRVFWAAVDTL
jgi:hypothetical protein